MLSIGLLRRVCQNCLFTPFWIFQHYIFSVRVPPHELCFLVVREIPLQTGNEGKVPHNFLRFFLPFLVSSGIAHRTCDHVCVLFPINVAMIDAHVVFFMRKSKGHTTFLASSQLVGHELPSGSESLPIHNLDTTEYSSLPLVVLA